MRVLAIFALISLTASGCVTAALEGANITKDKVTIKNNIDKANRGDPEAQYKVGDAYCCSVREEGKGFYNTRLAVKWLCTSAQNGYAPAMYKIGKIYSGDVIDGVRLGRRLAQGVAGTSENPPVAYAWLALAKKNGIKEADKRSKEVWVDMSVPQREKTKSLIKDVKNVPCNWDVVIRK